MFQMGALIGAYCRLKCLRQRFSGSAQNTSYSPNDAMDEHRARMAEYEAGRAQQHKFGPTYRCRHCALMFPADAFGVDRHDITDLHNMCVGLGSLRLCSVCVQVPPGTSTSRCKRCTQQRLVAYVRRRLGGVQALPPTGYIPFFRACSSCHKALQLNNLRHDSEGRWLCHDCAPEAWPYTCTCCKRHEPAADFRHSRRELEAAFHTRCKSCETCIECKRWSGDHRSMAADTRLCTKCEALVNRKDCAICCKKLDRGKFPKA